MGAIALGACGSTVPSAERAALQTGNGGLNAAVNGGTGPSAGGAGAGITGAGGAAGGPAAVNGGVGGSGGPGLAGGEVGGQSAQGVSDTTIKIGLDYDKSAGTLNQAYGFAGLGQIDQKQALELLVADVNARGGVAGRQLEIVWHVSDQLDGKTFEQRAQEMCAAWTQDDHVFAAFEGGTTTTLSQCLTDAGVAQVGYNSGLMADADFARFPYIVGVDTPSTEDIARFAVAGLYDQNFYSQGRSPAPPGGYKIGLVSYDDPAFKAAANALKQELANRGLQLADVVYIARAQSNADIAAEVNAERAAALRFKEEGITHVQFLMTSNAFGQLTFWQNAEKLLYRPRYGLTSMDGAQALAATLESSSPGLPANQWAMAVGVGWNPYFDVPAADFPPEAEPEVQRHCEEVTEAASMGGYNDDANKRYSLSVFCEDIEYFKQAVEAGGLVVNQQSWLNGVASITDRQSAVTFVANTSIRHAAIGATRYYAFAANCTCFHYTSDLRRV